MTHSFPYIFTFYSYKGGVGRSLALINVAYELARRGRHVLVVDFDIEAPGISGFLRRAGEITGQSKHDAIDLVQWACEAGDLPEDATAETVLANAPSFADSHLAVPVADYKELKPRYGDAGHVDVIGVDEGRNYFDRLTALQLHTKTREQLIGAGNALRLYFRSQRIPIEVPDYYPPDTPRDVPYDYVLVDSRTGTTEIGGLCVGPLSDRLIVLVGLNDQNVEGTRLFLEEIGLLRPSKEEEEPWDSAEPPPDDVDAPPSLGPKPTLLIASPVPYGEMRYKQERMAALAKALGQEVAGKLSYHPQMALMETLFVRDFKDEFLAGDYRQLTDNVMSVVRDSPGQLGQEVVTNLKDKNDQEVAKLFLRIAPCNEATLAPIRVYLEEPNLVTEEDFATVDRLFRLLVNSNSANLRERQHSQIDRCLVLRPWTNLLNAASVRNSLRQEFLRDLSKICTASDAEVETRAAAFLVRGITFLDFEPPDYLAAIRDWTSVDSMSGVLPELRVAALMLRAMSYAKLEPPDRQAQLADYTTVIEMPEIPPGRRAQALVNRGIVYGKLASPNHQAQLSDYNAVINMAEVPLEEHARALNALGRVAYRNGDLGSAIQMGRDALRLLPDNPNYRCDLALALLCLGNVEEASCEYHRALEDTGTLAVLEKIERDIHDAETERGNLPGTTEILQCITARREVLVRAGAPQEARDAAERAGSLLPKIGKSRALPQRMRDHETRS